MGFASFGLLMTNVLVSSVGKGGFKLVGLDSGCNGFIKYKAWERIGYLGVIMVMLVVGRGEAKDPLCWGNVGDDVGIDKPAQPKKQIGRRRHCLCWYAVVVA